MSLLFILGYAIYTSIVLTIFVFLFAGTNIVVEKIFSPQFQKLSKIVLEKYTDLKSYIHKSIVSFESIVMDPNKKQVLNHFHQAHQVYYEAILSRLRKQIQYSFITGFTVNATFLLFIVTGFLLIYYNKLAVEELVAFLIIYGRIFEPVAILKGWIRDKRDLRTYIERISEFVGQQRTAAPLATVGNRLAIGPVAYRYRNGNGIDRMNVTVEQGVPLIVRGGNGCGKSTWLKAIAGLMHLPQHAQGTNDFRIVYLSRYPDFFAGTLLENMLLGNDCKPEDFNALADQLACTFVEDLPLQWETRVDRDGGGQLSLGERQRLALLRAVMEHPDLLILDEATSALNPQLEEKILDFIFSVMAEKFIILVTHRSLATRYAVTTLQWNEAAQNG